MRDTNFSPQQQQHMSSGLFCRRWLHHRGQSCQRSHPRALRNVPGHVTGQRLSILFLIYPFNLSNYSYEDISGKVLSVTESHTHTHVSHRRVNQTREVLRQVQGESPEFQTQQLLLRQAHWIGNMFWKGDSAREFFFHNNNVNKARSHWKSEHKSGPCFSKTCVLYGVI